MSKLTVGVLFGGPSNEYEVSLRSAAAVLTYMDRGRYTPLPIGITRTGEWYAYSGTVGKVADNTWWQDEEHLSPVLLVPGKAGAFLINGERVRPAALLPVVHGQNCEDGRLQGLLTLLGIPFLGCGCTSSALCMDKAATKRQLTGSGIPMARWCTLTDTDTPSEREAAIAALVAVVGYPLFVKPSNSGSSVGCSRADDPEALTRAVAEAFLVDKCVLVEECVDAREIECAVLECGGAVTVSRPGEIDPGATFYDYETKYHADTASYFIPARVEEATEATLREMAEKIFRALSCSGLARVDFFLSRTDGRLLFNEINTLPGFTSISMYPKLMEECGIPLPSLIDRLIQSALETER